MKLHYCSLAIVVLFHFASITGLRIAVPAPPTQNAVSEGFRLISFAPGTASWLSPAEVDKLRFSSHSQHYMDVTDNPNPPQVPADLLRLNYPQAPRQQRIVRPLMQRVSPERLGRTIGALEDFHTRYYTQQDSRDAVIWLKGEYERVAALNNRSDVRAVLYEHDWLQPSLIVEIKGTVLPDEIVVVGGHIDSIAPGGASARAPGADDDASGSANAFDAFVAMVEGQYRPRRSIQFMAYAAEEVGLLGSRAIAQHYAARSQKVVAVYQAEMSGYIGNSNTVNIITDFVDDGLTRFLFATAKEYLDIDFVQSNCGYACSDHAPWTEVGYKSVMAMEKPINALNPQMHSDQDLLRNLDMQYSSRFSQLALAFAVEMAQF